MTVNIYVFKNSVSCCPGGACGSLFEDPTSKLIMVVNDVIREFKGQVKAELVDLLNYDVVIKHRDVVNILNQYGLLALPILKIEDNVVCYGFVPEREDVIQFIKLELNHKMKYFQKGIT